MSTPMNATPAIDLALEPAQVYIHDFPETLKPRDFQGIPGIACTKAGSLWATWYGGGEGEGPDNYIMVSNKPVGSSQWTEHWLVVRHDNRQVRAFDPTLWVDPDDRLWLFWAQTESEKQFGDVDHENKDALNTSKIWDGRGGVWGICCDKPDVEPETWSKPHRFCHGIMMNKPTVDGEGHWLMPASVWNLKPFDPSVAQAQRGPTVAICDGKTLDAKMQGVPGFVPEHIFDEHHIIPLADGRWAMWMRTQSRQWRGAVCYSSDRGKTWTDAAHCDVPCPNSRFNITRLSSGALLLVSHRITDKMRNDPGSWPARSHLAAWVSDDDGQTWIGDLLIDEREQVSYPDVAVADDGTIHIIYDFQRYHSRHILHVQLTEEQIRRGDEKITPEIVNNPSVTTR